MIMEQKHTRLFNVGMNRGEAEFIPLTQVSEIDVCITSVCLQCGHDSVCLNPHP